VKPLGYLLLGSNETLNHINFGFDPMARQNGVFRKRIEKPEEPIEDPTIKKPNGRKTFERAKRNLKDINGLLLTSAASRVKDPKLNGQNIGP